MNVALINGWRLPGCGSDCWPRNHNPLSHEAYGRRQALVFPSPHVVRTGALVIDLDAMTARVNGRPIDIIPAGTKLGMPRPWLMLALLARRIGRAVPYDEQSYGVLGYGLELASLQNLNVIRSRLRTLLGAARSLVVTVPSVGTRLEMVEPEPAP